MAGGFLFQVVGWVSHSFVFMKHGPCGACGEKTNAAMPGPMGRKRKAGILACGRSQGERGIIGRLWLEPCALLFDYFFLGGQEKVNNWERACDR